MILLTRTRSLISRVFSIEPDGIQNAWIAKVLISTASSRAMATRMGSSRQNDRFRPVRLRLRDPAPADPAGTDPAGTDSAGTDSADAGGVPPASVCAASSPSPAGWSDGGSGVTSAL